MRSAKTNIIKEVICDKCKYLSLYKDENNETSYFCEFRRFFIKEADIKDKFCPEWKKKRNQQQ